MREDAEFFAEAGGVVVEVMEVDFDVECAVEREGLDAVEERGLVLFLRIEGGEDGRLAGGVFGRGSGDGGPTVLPGVHAHVGVVEGGVAEGLEVVGERDPNAFWLARGKQPACAVAQIRREPQVGILRKLHARVYLRYYFIPRDGWHGYKGAWIRSVTAGRAAT